MTRLVLTRGAGLIGILFAPLMHGGFGHLIANTPPLLVLGTAMLYLYPSSARSVLPAIYLGPGAAVWLHSALRRLTSRFCCEGWMCSSGSSTASTKDWSVSARALPNCMSNRRL